MQIPNNLIKAGISLNDRYLDLPGLAIYSGLSVSSLRCHIRKNKLPAFSIPGKKSGSGKFLILQSEYDQWIRHFRFKPDLQDQEENSKASELLRRLKK